MTTRFSAWGAVLMVAMLLGGAFLLASAAFTLAAQVLSSLAAVLG